MMTLKINKKIIPIRITRSFSDPKSAPIPFVLRVKHVKTKANIKGRQKPTTANQNVARNDFKQFLYFIKFPTFLVLKMSYLKAFLS